MTIYSMSYGVTPFEAPEGSADWQANTTRNILHHRIRFLDGRKSLPMPAKIFVKSLLSRTIEKRLGASLDYSSILNHAWFRGVHWEKLSRMELEAPWIPAAEAAGS